jgi:CubicO group peptidase (beta-lactamase class C family)
MLVDRGLADYDDRVSRYWPEFGAAGKADITIAQLLSHQAGVTGFIEPTTLEELLNIDLAASRLAAQAPFWPPGEACGYHATSLGPLTATLFRRIEGRPVRQFVREEIAIPFGLDLSIGLDPADEAEAAEVVRANEGMDLGRFFKVNGAISAARPDNPNMTPAQAATMNPPIDGRYANLAMWRAADMPAANGFGNARSLAEFYALVLGHERHGRRLARPEILAQATRVRIEGVDQVKKVAARWSAAFQVNDGLYGPNPDTFYHAGLGGTFTLGDQAADLTISYTPNRLGDLFENDPRRRGLINAVYDCLGR